MEFIMQVCGAMALVACAMIALTIATALLYATIMIIRLDIKDKKKAKAKAAARKAKDEKRQKA